MIVSVIAAILFFGLIIFLHELGHFLAARLFGVTIHEFSVGMGPKIVSKRLTSRHKETMYSLRALPIGGYVSMAGEDDESDDPNAFCNKSKLARFVILFSGAFMNLLLGLLLMLVCVGFSKNLYSNKIAAFNVTDSNGDPVNEYRGLLVGDEIISIGGAKQHTIYDLQFSAMRNGDSPTELCVLRNGENTVVIKDFRFPTYTANGHVYGSIDFMIPLAKEKSVINVLHDTFFRTTSCVKTVVISLYDLIVGRYGAESLSGPVGVVAEIGKTTRYGLLATLYFAAMITINIGVFNLIPFPALDGWRIVLIGLELILRRKPDKRTENLINIIGLALLFGLMLMITAKDILGLFA